MKKIVRGRPLNDFVGMRGMIASRSAARKIATKIMELAKQKYLAKRIKTELPSRIISSFRYEEKIANKNLVRGWIMAGGETAPYIIYVEKYGWKTKFGRKEGYHFMEESVSEIVPSEGIDIIKKELAKVFGG